MAIEIKEVLPDISDLQRGIDEITLLEGLEREGIHVDSLAKKVDPTKTKVLASEVTHIHEEHIPIETKPR